MINRALTDNFEYSEVKCSFTMKCTCMHVTLLYCIFVDSEGRENLWRNVSFTVHDYQYESAVTDEMQYAHNLYLYKMNKKWRVGNWFYRVDGRGLCIYRRRRRRWGPWRWANSSCFVRNSSLQAMHLAAVSPDPSHLRYTFYSSHAINSLTSIFLRILRLIPIQLMHSNVFFSIG